MDRRTEEILPAAIPDAVGTQPCRAEWPEGRILRWIVIGRLAVGLHDAKVPAGRRRLEMERQVAVVARARNDRGRALINPDIRHAGASADRACIHIGGRAVE